MEKKLKPIQVKYYDIYAIVVNNGKEAKDRFSYCFWALNTLNGNSIKNHKAFINLTKEDFRRAISDKYKLSKILQYNSKRTAKCLGENVEGVSLADIFGAKETTNETLQ